MGRAQEKVPVDGREVKRGGHVMDCMECIPCQGVDSGHVH